jgi:hypothetical protein
MKSPKPSVAAIRAPRESCAVSEQDGKRGLRGA